MYIRLHTGTHKRFTILRKAGWLCHAQVGHMLVLHDQHFHAVHFWCLVLAVVSIFLRSLVQVTGETKGFVRSSAASRSRIMWRMA